MNEPHLRVWERQQWKIGPEDRAVGPQVAPTTCGPCQHRGPRGQVFVRGVVIGGEGELDKRSSCMRVAITIAIDWRFVTALANLTVALLAR
jgi:hypothetical protein